MEENQKIIELQMICKELLCVANELQCYHEKLKSQIKLMEQQREGEDKEEIEETLNLLRNKAKTLNEEKISVEKKLEENRERLNNINTIQL